MLCVYVCIQSQSRNIQCIQQITTNDHYRLMRGVIAVTRIMNVDEVARYLGVVPDTIYRKARRGEIPAVKMGKMWRFPKETLDKWLNDAALETVKRP